MGAGYTRWFRPGGNIRLSLGIDPMTGEKFVLAKPVWPNKKSFFGLYDPKPEFKFISEHIVGSFKHTVHKFGDDIYFLQPDVTYIDEATNFTEKQIKEFWNTAGKKIKGEKMPNPSKRQRFLDAGGSFDKPEQHFTDKDNIAITPCYNGPLCTIRPAYSTNSSPIHFHNPTKQQPKEVWFVKDRTHNFENILQNTDEYIWHASKGRKFYIRHHGSMISNWDLPKMADKHLISTMRYLVAAWKEIQETVGKYSPSSFAFVKKYFKLVREAKNAPSFYEIILPCWPTLVSEFVERFGSEALTSVLDGN